MCFASVCLPVDEITSVCHHTQLSENSFKCLCYIDCIIERHSISFKSKKINVGLSMFMLLSKIKTAIEKEAYGDEKLISHSSGS